jgi:hypothetical protein
MQNKLTPREEGIAAAGITARLEHSSTVSHNMTI